MTDREIHNSDADRADLSLQAQLDQMASEVPEMPESFRQGWREAVRAEARAASSSGNSVSSAGSVASRVSSGRRWSWQRSVSTAAVLAFLLGGALLGRDAARLQDIRIGSESLTEVTPLISEQELSGPGEDIVSLSAAPVSITASLREEALTASSEADAGSGNTAPAAADMPLDADSIQAAGAAGAPQDTAARLETLPEAEAVLSEEAAAPETEDVLPEEDAAAYGADFAEAEKKAAGPEKEAVSAEQETAAEEEKAAAEEAPEPAQAAVQAAASPGIRPLRLAGILLVCLALVLAALLLIFGRR